MERLVRVGVMKVGGRLPCPFPERTRDARHANADSGERRQAATQKNSLSHRTQEPDPDTASTSPSRFPVEPEPAATTVVEPPFPVAAAPRPSDLAAATRSASRLSQLALRLPPRTHGHLGGRPRTASNLQHRTPLPSPPQADRARPSAAAKKSKILHACRRLSVDRAAPNFHGLRRDGPVRRRCRFAAT